MPAYLLPITACNSTECAVTGTAGASFTAHGDGTCTSSIQGVEAGVAGEAEGDAEGQEEKGRDGVHGETG